MSVRTFAASIAVASVAVVPLCAAGTAGAVAPSSVVTVVNVAPVSVLKAGQFLTTRESLLSPNKVYRLVLQGDGNFVLYKDVPGKKAVALWSTHTVGRGATVALMQKDGNFVLYTAKAKAVFSTHTARTAGDRIQVQNDGNVVIYTMSNKATWSSNTAQKA